MKLIITESQYRIIVENEEYLDNIKRLIDDLQELLDKGIGDIMSVLVGKK